MILMTLAGVRCVVALVVRVCCWLLGLCGDAIGGAGADMMFEFLVVERR